jgi:anti-sigma B factor antagonist
MERLSLPLGQEVPMHETPPQRHSLGPVEVLALRGPLALGCGDALLRRSVQEILARGVRNLVLDLREVPSVDSTGIGELVSAFASARNRGARLVLTGPSRKVRDILAVTRLHSVFDCYETVEEAAASFSA